MLKMGDFRCAIDIGSNTLKIVTTKVINGRNENLQLEIQGCFEYKSAGIVRGEIVDIDLFTNKLKSAIDGLGKKITIFHTVNISTTSLQSYNEKANNTINSKIKIEDINASIKTHQNVKHLKDTHTLKIIPYNFKIDHKILTQKPIGIRVGSLDSYFHLVAYDSQISNKIFTTFQTLRLDIVDEVINSHALADMILSFESKRVGVCLLDIGHSTTDMIIIKDNHFKLTRILEFGVIDIIDNISYHYDCTKIEAQRLYQDFGFINFDNTTDENLIEFQSNGAQSFLSNYQLAEVIENSYLQLIDKIKILFDDNNISQINDGFVIIGGGSKITNLKRFLAKNLKTRVSLGVMEDNSWEEKSIVFTSKEKRIEPIYWNAIAMLVHKYDEGYKEKFIEPKYEKRGFMSRIIDKGMDIIK